MTDWKTTLFGIGAGALNLFANGTNWKQVLLSVSVTLLGIFAKDAQPTNMISGTSMK